MRRQPPRWSWLMVQRMYVVIVSVRDKHGVGTGAGYRGGMHMGLGGEPKREAGWMHGRGECPARRHRPGTRRSPSWRAIAELEGRTSKPRESPGPLCGAFRKGRASREPLGGSRSEGRTPYERSDAGSRRRQNILGDRRRQQGDWLATDAWRASMRARTRRSRLASETRCCSAIRS